MCQVIFAARLCRKGEKRNGINRRMLHCLIPIEKAYNVKERTYTIPSKMTRSTSLVREASSCDTFLRSITCNPWNKTTKKEARM